jgi:hypothetical protein
MIRCAKGAILNDKELSVIESALRDAIEYTHSLIETEFRPNRLTHDDQYRQDMKHRRALIRNWQTSFRAVKRVRKAKRRA